MHRTQMLIPVWLDDWLNGLCGEVSKGGMIRGLLCIGLLHRKKYHDMEWEDLEFKARKQLGREEK